MTKTNSKAMTQAEYIKARAEAYNESSVLLGMVSDCEFNRMERTGNAWPAREQLIAESWGVE